LWTEELDEMIQALLSHSPDQLGYPTVNWTIELLRRHIARWVGESFSEHTLRRHLHQLRYAWKRPRYVLEPDPQKTLKMRKIRANIAKLNERSVILFEDETDLLLFPPLRSAWARKGASAQVPLTGWNAKRVIFGAINARTGMGIYLSREHQRAPDFQFFLKTLQWHYRGWHITLILDEGKCHVARSTQILARSLNIDLLWLPHRSPELNPIESLWGKAKDAVCANRQYEDIDDQSDQFITFLQDLSSAEVLKKTGLTSSGFWLWKN
jgi:transposase